MPLDQQGFFIETKPRPDIAVIDRMIEQVNRPGSWCKIQTHRYDGAACLVGHIDIAKGWLYPTRETIIDAIAQLYPERQPGGVRSIMIFNDDMLTKHEDILRVLYRAREILSATP